MKASSIQSSFLYGLESSDTDVESDVSIHLIIAEREFHLKNEECDELFVGGVVIFQEPSLWPFLLEGPFLSGL